MTIRDLLSLNDAWFNDYIEIKKGCKTILKLTSISELHPVWLNYEIKKYYLLPHEEEEGIEKRISTVNCDYIITIDDTPPIFQQKNNLDIVLYESFNERIKENESTDNN